MRKVTGSEKGYIRKVAGGEIGDRGKVPGDGNSCSLQYLS